MNGLVETSNCILLIFLCTSNVARKTDLKEPQVFIIKRDELFENSLYPFASPTFDRRNVSGFIMFDPFKNMKPARPLLNNIEVFYLLLGLSFIVSVVVCIN